MPNVYFARAKEESNDVTIYFHFNLTNHKQQETDQDEEIPLYLTDMVNPGKYNVKFGEVVNGGLRGTYFADTMMTKKMIMMDRIDSVVNFTWSERAAASVRWNGFLRPPSGKKCCSFFVQGDNVRLWVNHALVIDRWHQSSTVLPMSAFSELGHLGDEGDVVEITLEVRQVDSLPSVKLMWSIDGIIDIIPQESLYFKVSQIQEFVNHITSYLFYVNF